MKKIKIIISLSMVIVLLVSVASCGKGEQNDLTTESTSPIIYQDENTNAYIPDTSAQTQVSTEQANQGGVVSTTASQPSSAPVQQSNAPSVPQEAPQTQSAQQTTKADEPTTSIATANVEQVVLQSASGQQTVFYPTALKSSNTTYPVIAWANGTMCPNSLYTNLLMQIAEGGYIVVANDETMAADGTAQLASVDFILEQNNDSSSVFYKKVNVSKIGLAGHSQGGRGSVNAAAANSRVVCVLSLAGSNYIEEAELLSAPTFFITGTRDMVVSSSQWVKPAYDVCKGPAVYASLDGAIHTTCSTDAAKYSGYAVKWFDAWLKGDKAAMNTFRNGGELACDSAWVDFTCKGL